MPALKNTHKKELLIHSLDFLNHFNSLASEEKIPYVLNNKHFITDSLTLSIIFTGCSPAQCKVISKAIANQFFNIIAEKNESPTSYFSRFLQLFPLEHAIAIIEGVSEVISEVFDRGFGPLLEYLPIELCEPIINNVMPQFLLKNGADLYERVQYEMGSSKLSLICEWVNKNHPNIFQHKYFDFVFLLFCSPEKNRLTLCTVWKDKLSQLISIENLQQALSCFSNEADKIAFQKLFFQSLLQEIKEKKDKFDIKHTQAKDAANQLHIKLSELSEKYFSADIGCPSTKNYFMVNVEEAISEARGTLQNHRGWKDFFAKLALTVCTLGIAPVLLSIASKTNTGSWQFRLFKTDSETKLDKISNVTELFIKP